MKIRYQKNKIEANIQPDEFSSTAIEKVLYWLTTDYEIESELKNDSTTYTFTPYNSDYDLSYHKKRIQNAFYDFNLRQKISDETRTIRELIIAKAFHPIENTHIEPNESKDSQ